MTAPTLTGFAPSVAFTEALVNAGPQRLDADVAFLDAEGDFAGGRLTVMGLLAEDRVSVRDEGGDVGQIGLEDTTLSYGGTVIGELTDGVGKTLTITFNGDATSEAVQATIQNLTYANASDAPTPSRTLVLNVTDAAGMDMGRATAASFAAWDANDPLAGLYTGSMDTPSFVDLDGDGDGDDDAVVHDHLGYLYTFRNGTDGEAGDFAYRGNGDPFSEINYDLYGATRFYGSFSALGFVDLDGDGNLDAVIGDHSSTLVTLRNGTDGTEGDFTAWGPGDPFEEDMTAATARQASSTSTLTVTSTR